MGPAELVLVGKQYAESLGRKTCYDVTEAVLKFQTLMPADQPESSTGEASTPSSPSDHSEEEWPQWVSPRSKGKFIPGRGPTPQPQPESEVQTPEQNAERSEVSPASLHDQAPFVGSSDPGIPPTVPPILVNDFPLIQPSTSSTTELPPSNIMAPAFLPSGAIYPTQDYMVSFNGGYGQLNLPGCLPLPPDSIFLAPPNLDFGPSAIPYSNPGNSLSVEESLAGLDTFLAPEQPFRASYPHSAAYAEDARAPAPSNSSSPWDWIVHSPRAGASSPGAPGERQTTITAQH